VPDAVDLEPRLDELFAAAPEAFVATRESLVRDLKRTGRAADAVAIHALRRPTIAVWGINQMARSRADRLATLIAAGADVERLQTGGADAGDELRAASRARHALLAELTEVAARLTDRPDTYRASIAATLDAASLDLELQDELLRGRLTVELGPAVRFLGDVDDASPPARRARATRAAPPTPARDDLAARRAKTALAEARARAAEVEGELHEVEVESRDAQDMLDAAHRRVAEVEAALVDARAGVAEARRRAAESQRTETKVRTAQRRAEAALHVAERRAEET
jgi:hypothetical protein